MCLFLKQYCLLAKMTRFARAKGSKSSNQRLPETATSWQDMKQNVPQKNNVNSEKNITNMESGNVSTASKEEKVKWSNFTDNNKKSKKGKPQNSKNNNKQFQKFKSRQQNDKDHKRRKPFNATHTMYINGNEIELAYFDGFPIKKDDFDRLSQLKKDMISKGLPRSEVFKALKLERRKAEKALAREKKKVCFNCRESGHALSECPQLGNSREFETGICFKCGSTEHTHFECKVNRGDNYKFAQCFICKEQGHIARQCPDNSRGLYPKGGACNVCGDVTHLKKDCPKYQAEQQEQTLHADMINDDVEGLGNEQERKKKANKNVQKIVKF